MLAFALTTYPGGADALSRSQTGTPSYGTDVSQLDTTLRFIENVGQFDTGAHFQVQGGPGTLWLAQDAIWLSLTHTEISGPHQAVNLRFRFSNANPHSRLEPFQRLNSVVHYYRGSDPSQWHTDVPVWGGVRYVDIYPGVDLEITGEGQRMAWRFAIRDTSFDPNDVHLQVEGGQQVTVRADGLHVDTLAGSVTLPLLSIDGNVMSGISRTVSNTDGTFEIAAPFAPTPEGVTFPQMDYPEEAYFGSYLGGSGNDWVYDLALSGEGDILDRNDDRAVWIAGWTASSNFPTYPGVTSLSGPSDAFVTRMERGAIYVAPTFSAYIGGSDEDGAQAIATDASGNAYVAGWTRSSNFATAGTPYDATHNGCMDAFVLKLDEDGTLLYSTYLGGSHVTIPGLGDQCGDDEAAGIAVNAQGIVYLTGSTYSDDFPTTSGAYDTVLSYFDVGINTDTFVAKLDPSRGTNGLLYSTFVGGGTSSWGEDIAIDGNGRIYVTGNAAGGPGSGLNYFPTTSGAYDEVSSGDEAFFFKLNPGGHGVADMLYSTFLGSDGAGDYGYGIALDSTNHAYVCGRTSGAGFPTTAGALDTTCGTDGACNTRSDFFVSRLNPAGGGASDLLYSTFLGGDLWEGFYGGCDIALGTNGDVYVTGDTSSTSGFPITSDAYDQTGDANWGDAFVVRLHPQGNGAADLIYGTYVGGTYIEGGGTAIAVDDADGVYVVGETRS